MYSEDEQTLPESWGDECKQPTGVYNDAPVGVHHREGSYDKPNAAAPLGLGHLDGGIGHYFAGIFQ